MGKKKNPIPHVKHHRESAGLSQAKLADLVATSKTHLQRIESGEQVPTVYLAIRIAEALGKNVHEVFSVTVKKPTKKDTDKKH